MSASDFEEPYLAALKDYYQRESTNFIAQNGVSLYMRKAEKRIEEEDFRARKYLHEESIEKVFFFLSIPVRDSSTTSLNSFMPLPL